VAKKVTKKVVTLDQVLTGTGEGGAADGNDEAGSAFAALGTPAPSTYLEYMGLWLMLIALGAIVVVGIVTVVSWTATRPTLASLTDILPTATTIDDARDALGSAASHQEIITYLDEAPIAKPADAVEMYKTIRQEHTASVTDLFQTVVVSALLPIFTLIAGYVFGKEASRRDPEQTDPS